MHCSLVFRHFTQPCFVQILSPKVIEGSYAKIGQSLKIDIDFITTFRLIASVDR